MSDIQGRRKFIKSSLIFGAGTIAGFSDRRAKDSFRFSATGTLQPILAAVKGPNYSANVLKALELLGGMEKFVPKGSKVALLPNSQSPHPGTFTNTAVLSSVIKMCHTAGAFDVHCLSWLDLKHWERSGLGRIIAAEGAKLVLIERKDENFQKVSIPQGVNLKETFILKELFRYDVLINLPIAKHHEGNRFTGSLKNLMGLNAPSSNASFHKDDRDPLAVPFLDQCIADLNLAIAPKLNLVDATEYITTNGPFGPGEIRRSQFVVAGTDRVAIDAFCATLMGMAPEDIIMIGKAHEHGLGEMELSKVHKVVVEL
jgi:uncharacterized protein (DUF362 family)